MNALVRLASASLLVLGASVPFVASSQAQLPPELRDYPLARLHKSGDLVTPFFDGWYDNGDGTVTYVFGFMNRNLEEIVDIPLGQNNHIEPAQYDGVQPTHFPVFEPKVSRSTSRFQSALAGGGIPRGLLRERGAFSVTVPDRETEVVWTISHAGHTYSIPGRATSTAYEMSRDAAAFGSLNPAIRFTSEGPESIDREGIMAEPVRAMVGVPVELSAMVKDRGIREHYDTERNVYPVTAAWIHHQGAGSIHFEPQVTTLDSEGWGTVTTLATFSEPGQYVVRLRVDNFGAPDSSFGKQCCWSNAYIPVSVGR